MKEYQFSVKRAGDTWPLVDFTHSFSSPALAASFAMELSAYYGREVKVNGGDYPKYYTSTLPYNIALGAKPALQPY
jgi:hypothetical protein